LSVEGDDEVSKEVIFFGIFSGADVLASAIIESVTFPADTCPLSMTGEK